MNKETIKIGNKKYDVILIDEKSYIKIDDPKRDFKNLATLSIDMMINRMKKPLNETLKEIQENNNGTN